MPQPDVSQVEFSIGLADELIAECNLQRNFSSSVPTSTFIINEHHANEGSLPSSHTTSAMLMGWDELSEEDQEYHPGSSFDEAFEDLSAIRSESEIMLGVQEGITQLTQQMFSYMSQQ